MELGKVHPDDITAGKPDKLPGLPVRRENDPRLRVGKESASLMASKSLRYFSSEYKSSVCSVLRAVISLTKTRTRDQVFSYSTGTNHCRRTLSPFFFHREVHGLSRELPSAFGQRDKPFLEGFIGGLAEDLFQALEEILFICGPDRDEAWRCSHR